MHKLSAAHPTPRIEWLCVFVCVFALAPRFAAAEDTRTPDQQAQALFEADWQWRLRSRPELATALGDYRFDASLSDTSLAASRAATAHERDMLAQARLLARDSLAPQARLSYDLFVIEKESALKAAAFYPYMVQPITAHQGIHLSLGRMVAQMPFATEAGYRNYLARLDALPRHVDGLIEQMREGMRTGWTAPRDSMRALPAMLRELRRGIAGGNLALPFRRIPSTIDKPVRDELAVAGPAALRAKAAPALQKLEDFIRAEYLPAARAAIGAASLPGGADYYAFLLRERSGSELAAPEIHALGLREVARIRGAMDAVIARTGFKGSFAQFARFANSDPRLFYRTPGPLLERYRTVIARAEARLPRLFFSVPDQQVGVKQNTEAGAAQQGGAYYEAGAPDRPAALVVNTSRLATRPMWEIETLALHEALPGHHLQVARAREMDALPQFRRYGWHGAFGEGWALYAESLGPELGFFADPFSRFGHLNAELLRAARLVADTGIHALGWTRRQAVAYLNANTANAPLDNEVEVGHYIDAPGQAAGYKLGQLKIRALRDKAQAALGARFDVRAFHAAVIDGGALPASLLERQVDGWIAAAQAATQTPLQTAVQTPAQSPGK